MGAWGTGLFDNDDAADFVQDIEENGVEAIIKAIDQVLETDGYLEAPEGSIGLAGAQFIAASMGRTEGFSEEALQAFAQLEAEMAKLRTLKDRALAAVERVVSQDSELIELWEESDPDDLTRFKSEVESLRIRLTS